MLELERIRYFKLENNSLTENKLESILKLFKLYSEYRDSPLPLYSDEHNKKWILTPEYADYINTYYFAEDLQQKTIIGMVNTSINKGKNNPHLAYFNIFVHPQYRKNGIAKQMLKMALKDIPKYVKKIMIFVRQKNEELHEFLLSKGAKHSFTERRSVCDIKTFDYDQVSAVADSLLKKAIDKGYEIFFVKQTEFESNKYFSFQEYIEMIENISNDMPREESSIEDIDLTLEEYSLLRDHFINLGQSMWTFVAVHKGSRKPVGMTETWFSVENPTLLIQADTGIIQSHRGNRLGLTLKYQMLKRLLSHESNQKFQYWVTSNADSNQYMISINNQLGYKEIIVFNAYEIDKEIFTDYIKKYA